MKLYFVFKAGLGRCVSVWLYESEKILGRIFISSKILFQIILLISFSRKGSRIPAITNKKYDSLKSKQSIIFSIKENDESVNCTIN